MNPNILKYLIAGLAIIFISIKSYSQENNSKINIEELTLEQMKNYTQDDLLMLSFEDLIVLVKKFKLSSVEELYSLMLNPTQSTASKMEEDVFNAPLATTVISSDELKKSGARSIPEALRLAPGIIVREKTNGNYDVHIRGNDYIPPGSDLSSSVNSTTLVMIDNRPVYNNFLGATFWENLPVSINDLDKIEIIYGPSAALYGPNAVSGVIHLITKKVHQEGISSNFDIQAGNNNTQIANGTVAYNKGNWSLNLSGNYQYMDRFQDTYYIPQNEEYISGEEVGKLNSQMDTNFIASEFNSDYWKAKSQGAINFGAIYSPSKKLNISYYGSYQSSSVQTSYMDIGSVLSTRESSSFSNSLNINAGKFEGHISGVFGKLNAVEGMPGYEYDYREVNAKFGYNFKYKNLIIRPGIDANYAYYSDEEYVDITANDGLLNGSAELGTFQGSLRLDYTAFNRLRIVGAWMQGYFYQPQRDYNSYQFATSYKLNDNTLIRLVASNSHSSPFILNTYMDKTVQTPLQTEIPNQTNEGTMTLNMVGNKDLQPQEMSMIEFGIRHKLLKNLQADISVFYNKSKNYSQLISEQAIISGPSEENNYTSDSAPIVESTVITESMQNMDLNASQIGATVSFKYVLNERFNASVFGTYQKTDLNDYKVSNALYYENLTGISVDDATLSENPEYLSFEHKYTPSIYGGATVNYSPSKKWNFNTSLYGYSKQESFYTNGQSFYNVSIDPKITCNFKASYQINNWLGVYLNTRNITNNVNNEFMYTDKTGSTYLVGLNIKL